MEILADTCGYIISIDSAKGELEALKNGTLEGEILSVIGEDPYNVPTGKKLTLCIYPNIKEISVRCFPINCDWNSMKRLEVGISPDEYKEIYYGHGRVYGTRPRLSIDILVQDMNAA